MKRLLIIGFLLVCAVMLCRTPISRRLRWRPFPSAIVVHESASPWGDVKSIRVWHQHRGWLDIGYHAVILNGRRSRASRYNSKLDGKIEPGRPEREYGAHCEADGMNCQAIGVCLVGDPELPSYPTKRQLDALVYYCAAKCRQYRIPVLAITQHSDHEPLKPLCASLDMNEIRRRVREELERP